MSEPTQDEGVTLHAFNEDEAAATDPPGMAAEAEVNAEEAAAIQRTRENEAYERKLQPPPVQSMASRLQDEIERVRLIVEAYNNDRAHVLRDQIASDVQNAEAALAQDDEPLQEYHIAILSAHKL